MTPDDIREIRSYVEANRTLSTPFDIVVGGQTAGLDRPQLQDKLLPRQEAGLTWWIEEMPRGSEEQIAALIRRGPARLD